MKQNRSAAQIQFVVLLIGTALVQSLVQSGVLAQSRNAPSFDHGDHWVSTWATAQSLAPGSGRGGGRAGAAAKQGPPPATPAQNGAGQGRGNNPQGIIPPSLNDQTMRMVI